MKLCKVIIIIISLVIKKTFAIQLYPDDMENFIPKDSHGGYFISYKNGIRQDVKVSDVVEKYKKQKNLR